MQRWPDRIVTAVVVIVIVAAPLAFGAANRSAFVVLEAACFVSAFAWALKIWLEAPSTPRLRVSGPEFGRIVLPIVALGSVFLLQIIPMPSRVLGWLSPTTHNLYRIAYPGWPGVSRFQALAPIWRIAHLRAPDGAITHRWLTLSISPTVSSASLLEWSAIASLFLVVLAFPFGLVGERDAERRFYRIALGACAGSALLIAIIGLAERAFWNGKLLWFHVPEDWGGPLIMASPRASGPFVDPDHFANYLAMILPLTVIASIFPLQIVGREHESKGRLAAALASLIIAAAILLSLSRAGMIAAIVGVIFALALAICNAAESAPTLWLGPAVHKRALLLVGCAITLMLCAFAVGPIGLNELGARWSRDLGGQTVGIYRIRVWRDTLAMIREFPIFGVGLGCWPELFPHYQRPPWTPFFFREAENDYLQFIAEAGLLGTIVVLWFTWSLVKTFTPQARALPPRAWPLVAGLSGGLVAMVLHETFDFSLRTPANAVLFAILAALTLRIIISEAAARTLPRLATRSSHWVGAGAGLAGALVLLLIGFTIAQDGRAYPYRLERGPNIRQQMLDAAAHPVMASAHILLADRLMQAKSLNPGEIDLRDAELRAAAWLEPNDPDAHDRYARVLLRENRKAAGLNQITDSVYRAPRIEAHAYLAPGLVSWLLPEEQDAIGRGFERAVESGFAGALVAASQFDTELGRYAHLALLDERASAREPIVSPRLAELVEAGRNYALAQDEANAVRVLRKASAIDPTDARPYGELARSVYGPRHEITLAQQVIEEGLRQGGDVYALRLALADALDAAGEPNLAERSLESALKLHLDFEPTMRLGTLYLQNKDYAKAALSFAQATSLRPESAAAWFALGESHEADYDYQRAGRDYERAHQLEPANHFYERTAADFEKRTSAVLTSDRENEASQSAEMTDAGLTANDEVETHEPHPEQGDR